MATYSLQTPVSLPHVQAMEAPLEVVVAPAPEPEKSNASMWILGLGAIVVVGGGIWLMTQKR